MEDTFKRISKLVDEWLEIHKGESFDLDIICKQLQIQERENRHNVAKKLSYELSRGELDKNNRTYRQVDHTTKYIDWVNANESEVVSIKFPISREDNTSFSFEQHIILSPKDLIVIAGNSNAGKTAWILNMLWENMDSYPCTLMGNEYSPAKFKRRVSRMTWASPLKEDGTPKFELIERYRDWKDIIRPNNLNFVDWITVESGEFYKMDSVLQGLQSKTDRGMVIAAIQKSENKKLGEGSDFSKRISSLYLTIDYERLTVEKAKEWDGVNPNNKQYRFKIVDGGTKFHDIHEIKKCGKCYGAGKSHGQDCDVCQGTGYKDVND